MKAPRNHTDGLAPSARNDTANHTPIPWQIDPLKIGTVWNIDDAAGRAVALTQQRTNARGVVDHERTANAAFIVRAVNAHDALVAALNADAHDLQEIRNAVDGLEGDAREVARLLALIDGRRHGTAAALRSIEDATPRDGG